MKPLAELAAQSFICGGVIERLWDDALGITKDGIVISHAVNARWMRYVATRVLTYEEG